MNRSIALAVALAFALAGCGKEEPKPAAPAPAPTPPPAAKPAAPVAAAPAPAPKPAAKAEEKWELLGEMKANLKQEKERLVVGKQEGKFRELRVTVEDAPLEMISMTITFGNGKEHKADVKTHFDEKAKSKVIDLPGDARVIKHVDFVYKTAKKGEGKATVLLHGR